MIDNNYLDLDGEHGFDLGENPFYQNYEVKLKK